ncbi:MAG: hypothetical protein JST50_19140 [Bacteroidetes bacterium]|jgi:hypothetical protein|nr:hypothetical protein [Bacteroidota bacterium]
MKTSSPLIKALFTILISCFSIAAFAQAPFTGPSDASVPSGNIQQYVCSGGQILLKSSTVATQYLWYKKNTSGSMVLVQSGASNTYTETASPATSAGTGYYTYTLVTENATGCLSDMSAPYNIFVLPPITPTISGPTAICASTASNPTSITLTAAPVNDANYSYVYQWNRNGVAIPGATSSTYTGTETAAGSVTYTVDVSYSSTFTPATCTVTGTQTITVNPIPATPTIQWN